MEKTNTDKRPLCLKCFTRHDSGVCPPEYDPGSICSKCGTKHRQGATHTEGVDCPDEHLAQIILSIKSEAEHLLSSDCAFEMPIKDLAAILVHIERILTERNGLKEYFDHLEEQSRLHN